MPDRSSCPRKILLVLSHHFFLYHSAARSFGLCIYFHHSRSYRRDELRMRLLVLSFRRPCYTWDSSSILRSISSSVGILIENGASRGRLVSACIASTRRRFSSST